MDKTRTPLDLTKPRAAIGSHVEVALVDRSGSAERLAFDIVQDKKADFYSGLLSAGTPLAQAILGKTAGSVVPYTAGDVVQVRVLSVTVGAATSGDAAARRQAAVREAVEQAESTNAMIFATTVEGKWGEYDTDAIK